MSRVECSEVENLQRQKFRPPGQAHNLSGRGRDDAEVVILIFAHEYLTHELLW